MQARYDPIKLSLRFGNSRAFVPASQIYEDPPDIRAGLGTIVKTRKKLRMLLTERSLLLMHPESKELPLNVLTAGKPGSKLSESSAVELRPGLPGDVDPADDRDRSRRTAGWQFAGATACATFADQ